MVYAREAKKVTQLGELDTICAKQFLEDPEAVILTAPIAFNSSFTSIPKQDLKEVCEDEGVLAVDTLTYPQMIDALKAKLSERFVKERGNYKSLAYYEGQIAERTRENPAYYAKFAPETEALHINRPAVTSGRISAATSNKSASPSSIVRPKSGSTTAKVWEIADEMRKLHPDLDQKSLRALIIPKCEENGINPATAATQFSKWKGAQSWG
jgi:hypothetical protein